MDGRLSSVFVSSIAHAQLKQVPESEVVSKTINQIVKDDNVVKAVQAKVYSPTGDSGSLPILKTATTGDSGSLPVLKTATSGTLATSTLNTKLARRKKRAMLAQISPDQILKQSLSVAKNVASDKVAIANAAGLTLAHPETPVLDVSGKIRGEYKPSAT